MLFISSQNLRKKKRKKNKHVQPSLLSDLPPWVGSKVDWPWHKGQIFISSLVCWKHTTKMYKSNKTNGFHGHVMSHDVIWCNSCWLGNAATPLVASTAECERPAATATWAMSHQCHHLSFHPPISKAAPRAKQQSEAKVARSQWVVGASPRRTLPSTRDLPGTHPLWQLHLRWVSWVPTCETNESPT